MDKIYLFEIVDDVIDDILFAKLKLNLIRK